MMPVITPQAIAAYTIGFGVLSCIVGIGLLIYFKPCRAGRQGITALVSYAFTASPIGLLVYNCLAFAINDWILEPTAGGAAPEPAVANIAASPTLGAGAPLLAYAGIAVLVHISADVWGSIKAHLIDNP